MKTLTMSNRLGYAMGDVANSLSFGMASMFLLAYYTDVLGISAAAAGTLFLVARLWDAINDPIMGTLCDRLFSTSKGEKFRPFLLKGSWPVIVAAILVFWVPEGLSDTQKLVWAYVTYIVYGMAYTFINIPYGSLATVMTKDPEERASLSGARAMGGTIGMVSCNIIVPMMLSVYSDDLAKAYLYSISGLGVVAFIGYLISYRTTAEHIKHEPSPETAKVSFKDTIKTLAKNKPFICVSLVSTLMLTAMFCQGSMLYYYLSVNLDNTLWIISFSAIMQVAATIMIAPSAGKLCGRFGTKKLMLIGFGGTSIIATLAFFLPTGVYGTLFFYVLGTPCLMLPNILIWANVADCIDHNYELSGQRQEGIIYSSYSFMRKLGQALAGFIAGVGLSLVGYEASLEVQADGTMLGIKMFLFLLPAVAMGVSFFIYRLMWTLGSPCAEPGSNVQVTE
ncbi:MFS transporter [Vibrio sp. 10N.222.52.C3]|uniref:MFS transporter n=1 Tax=Vibrio sp. 10N.222.52.C3 TaxID=3229631 RepID=UPI00354AF4BF